MSNDPVQTTKTSVLGVINMFGLAKRLRARILQASTSEVYGDPREHPQGEEYWEANDLPRGRASPDHRVLQALRVGRVQQHALV